MDSSMQFRSSKGLDKTLTFKISLKRIITWSSVKENLYYRNNDLKWIAQQALYISRRYSIEIYST